jgi:ankyrin repeat protein
MVQYLLEQGADPNKPNKNNRTPGHNAAFKGRVEILNLMLEHELNVYSSNNKGRSIIAEAATTNLIFNKEANRFENGGAISPVSSSNSSMIAPPPQNASSSQTNSLQNIQENLDRMERKLNNLTVLIEKIANMVKVTDPFDVEQ